MTKFLGRRSRLMVEQKQNELAQSGKRKRRRINDRLVKDEIFMPVTIKNCNLGIPISNGKTIASYDLEHLVSGENFTATVFENSYPDYIEDKIIDAVLPEDLEFFWI